MSSSNYNSYNTSSSSSGYGNPTKNFRPEYIVRTTRDQEAEYRRDQAAYREVPRETMQTLAQQYEKVDRRTQQWKQRMEEREIAWEETSTARIERRDRTDPDIKYLRNKKNREEHALTKLDHAQRDYMATLERTGGRIEQNDRIQKNRIPEASNYRTPVEIQDSIGRYAAHSDYRPVTLPSNREYLHHRKW